ncbi:MAG: hypothetical protein K0S21_229 [Rhizobiaceae bacterium]|jgi:hypothetical protein|nr:hypothetical protein [Rhizobiaceae bacterium]
MQRQDKIDVLGTERFSMPDKGPGTGGLAMALLLGSAAIALALVLPPIAERLIRPQSTRPRPDDHRVHRKPGVLHDTPQHPAAFAGFRLHHSRQRAAERRLLTPAPLAVQPSD